MEKKISNSPLSKNRHIIAAIACPFCQKEKRPPPRLLGTKGKPSAVPPAFAYSARSSSGNGGGPVPLSGAAPGRTKRAFLRAGFQPTAAPL